MIKITAKRNVLMMIIMLFVLFVCPMVALGASFEGKVEANSTKIKAGESIEIKLYLHEYAEIDKGINAYKATIDYDENIFQKIELSDFKSKNSWEEFLYNKDTHEFIAIKKAGSKEPEEVVSITLKAKKEIKAGQTIITIKDIVTSEGKEDIKTNDVQLHIDVIAGQSGNDQGSTGESNNPNNPNNPDQENQEKPNGPNQEDDMATGKIPQTGQGSITSFVLIAIELLIAIAIIAKCKEKGIDKKIKKKTKIFLMILCFGVISAQITTNIYAATTKGELNDDGKIDYVDVSLLEQHLIHLKSLPQDKLDIADMNGDGRLTVTDLSLLVRKIENSIDYTVKITSNLDSYYANKNEEIDFQLIADVSNGAKLKAVVVNGVEYKAEEVRENSSGYVIKIKAGNQSGIQELKFTKAILDVGKEVKLNHVETIEILKDTPYIDGYMVQENLDENKLVIKFNLVDIDRAITAAGLQILDHQDNKVKTENIQVGENTIEFSAKEKEKYKLQIYASYNLDTDSLGEHEEDNTGRLTLEKELEMLAEYDFDISNIQTYNEAGNTANSFAKEEDIIIKFDSHNASKAIPETVKINGQTYDVVEESGKYKVTIPGVSTVGNHQFNIEEVILTNGKVIELKDISFAITVHKKEPTVENFEVSEDISQNILNIKFNIKDEDNTIKYKKYVVTNSSGDIIIQKEFVDNEIDETIELLDTLTKEYTIKIIATYNASGEEVVNKEILTKTIKAQTRVNILEAKISKTQVEKGQKIDITYTIETNKEKEIAKIIVNNIEANVIKKDGKYVVTIEVGTIAGMQDIKTTDVIFEDGTQVNTEYDNQVEVLKDKPSVDLYKATDKYDENKVDFEFVLLDKDNAILSAKAQLIKQEDNSIWKETEIAAGDNYFDFEVEQNVEYEFRVIASYSIDANGENQEIDRIIFLKPIQIIQDYNLQISDITTYQENGDVSKYFDRNYNIKLSFSCTNATKFYPEKAVINGKEYSLQRKDNIYTTLIDSFDTSGVKEIKIEKVYMNNTKELEVNGNNTAKIEILKLAPSIENFEYTQEQEKAVIISFDFVDAENTVKTTQLTVTDENGTVVGRTENLTLGKQKLKFTTTESENYFVKIVADYDLDTNELSDKDNESYSEQIFGEEITIAQELIEFKDIETVKLYQKENDKVVETEEVDVTKFDKNEYIAQVIMKDLPDFYAEIKDTKIENEKFILVLDYNNVVQYDGDQKENKLEVEFGGIDKNHIASNLSFAELVERINEDPTGEFVLHKDLDANDLSVSTQTIITTDFKGKLNGNGHTIKNLKKPLFGKLNNAEITNLIIENATVSGPNMGILANNALGGHIHNVHVRNSTMNAGHTNGTGGMVGKTENGTLIENSSVTNIKVSGYKRVGGIVGFFTTDSKIRNSYVTGTITGNYDAIGGIEGEENGNCSIENCYVDITYNVVNNWSHGGITGFSSKNGVTLKNNLSLATGKTGKRVAGTGCSGQSTNNYEIAESELDSNADDKAITEISNETIDDKFFTDTLGWDSTIWRLEGVNKDNLPTLRNADPNDIQNTNHQKPDNEDVYIPEIDRLRAMDNYHTEKEVAYHNIYRIMPFYDAKYILHYGNKIENNHLFNQSKIKMVIPYDNKDNMIVGLNTNNYQDIAKIRIIFENEETQEYRMTFDKKLNDIAIYDIADLGIKYNYNKYILDTSISSIKTIVDKAKKLDYASEIALITPEEESRLYIDYYNESVKNKIEDVILAVLENTPEYNLYLDNEILKLKVEQELLENQQLEKIMHTYNYFDKWYHIEMGGIPLTNIIFTNVNDLNPNQTILSLVDLNMAQGPNMRNTNNTVNFFNNVIKPELGDKSIEQFLEYFMKVLEGQSDGNEWFEANFKGLLNEKPALGRENTIRYRAWDLIKSRGKVILPILSAPQEDMYIISVPSQLVIGSLNRYNQHLNGDIEGMKKLMDNYATMIGNFYGTSSTFIGDAERRLNTKTYIQYDTRFAFPNIGDQNKGTTQDPVIKWVYEAIGSWAAANGSGAYADGTDVYWVYYQALGGEFSFKVFTHETAHNQDGGYFYEGNGRRRGTWAEDHADANIAQDLGDGSFVFNLRGDMQVTVDDSVNLSLARITGSDNIYSYYKEMFETYYVLDYLTGQAFLQLTPEEQAKVAVQATHDGEADYENGGSKTTYKQITADEFEKMNLKTMEDLWNNGIALRGTGSVGDGGEYGGDSHYSVYWYQPHNNEGRPDSYSFKRLGFEMLGVGGYSNGYVIYRSNKSSNDLDALRKITGNDTITWKTYKLDRYRTVESNLSKIPYFDTNEVIKAYKEALEKDAKAGNRSNTNALRRVIYGMIKRATRDFTTGTIYSSGEEIQISSAEEFVQILNQATWGNYILTNDLDFSNISTEEVAYIGKIFVGRINGDGHKIKGVTKPIFADMTYAEIQNLVIEEPKYELSTQASIGIKAKNTLLNNVIIENSNINVPFAKTIQGTLQKLGDTQINVKVNEINTIEDLQNISANELSIKMKYTLNADIDLSPITEGNAVVTGAFTGEFVGNGHILYNLNMPLFENLGGTVKNLTISNMSLDAANTTNIGALAKVANNATVENIVINGVNIKGRENLGAIVGSATGSNFYKITAENINVSGPRFYIGGAIGRTTNTKISDIKVAGNLSITSTHNGGIIGAMNGGTLENVYGNVTVERPSNTDNRNQNGGLIGSIESGNPVIRNSINVANVEEDVYKVIGGINGKTAGTVIDKKNYISNVYETVEALGISNTNEDNNIKAVESSKYMTKEFYTTVLGWSEDIWDFSDMQNGPKIK